MRDRWRVGHEFPEGFELLLDRLLGKERRQFVELIGADLPVTFRFNPLKHSLEYQVSLLEQQGFSFHALSAPQDAWQVDKAPYSIGKTFSHFTGHLYVQDLSSMLPPLALEPKAGELVLDMCASPGSKATQIAALMANRGMLLANDSSRRRARNLISNLRRLGVLNTAVSSCPGEQLGNLYFEQFDRVLLDPPCSALGTLHKSPSVLGWWTPARSHKLAAIQKGLLQAGLKALKPGGVLVYSTCTITPEENEEVIQFALDHFPVELEPIQIKGLGIRSGLTEYARSRYDSTLEQCVRLYPVDNPSEGFFLARLRKQVSFGQKRPSTIPVEDLDLRVESDSELFRAAVQVLDYYGIESGQLTDVSLLNGGHVVLLGSLELAHFPLTRHVITAGLPFARTNGPLGLTTEGVQLCGHRASCNYVELDSVETLGSFLNRQDLEVHRPDSHQVVVLHQKMGIGHGLISQNRLASRFPRSGIHFDFSPLH